MLNECRELRVNSGVTSNYIYQFGPGFCSAVLFSSFSVTVQTNVQLLAGEDGRETPHQAPERMVAQRPRPTRKLRPDDVTLSSLVLRLHPTFGPRPLLTLLSTASSYFCFSPPAELAMIPVESRLLKTQGLFGRCPVTCLRDDQYRKFLGHFSLDIMDF